MKIIRVDVDGYGVLADFHVDKLSAGLSLVIGENEAGKTTLLDFVRGVLFGFPGRNRRLQQHLPIRGGRHGGSLGLVDDDGRGYRLERFVGSGEAKLASTDGGSLPLSALQRLLGGADEALFRNVFAFGLSELSLFESLDRAEVRDVLFSAGVLGAGRSARRSMQELESLRTTLVRPRKDDVRGNALSRRVAMLDAEMRAARRRADAYPGLFAEHSRLQSHVQEKRHQLEDLRQRTNEIDRLVALWPTWRSRLEATGRLEELGPARDQLETAVALAENIRYLREARSGHLERLEKHRDHLGAIETATVELEGILTRLGGVRIAPIPLAVTEELSQLTREAPLALATLRAADDMLRKAVLAERESKMSKVDEPEAPPPAIDEIERRIALVHRLELAIGRERLERERVAKQQSDAAAQRAMRARQRGGADLLTSRLLLATSVGVIALGVATATLGHRHGTTLTALGIGGAIFGVALLALALRMRRTLNSFVEAAPEIDDTELLSLQRELQRMAADLSLDVVDESGAAAAAEELQRLLSRRRRLDDAVLVDARLRLESENARAEQERARDAVASIDERAAKTSILLGFSNALGVEGLAQAVEAITKAQELRDRIDRIRRADDLIAPAIESFQETLQSTEAALLLEPDEDVTRRVRRLEVLLDEASADQRLRVQLAEAIAEATAHLHEGLGSDAGGDQWNALSTGELASWEAERAALSTQVLEAQERYEELVGELRDKERELEEVTTSSEMSRLATDRSTAAAELDDVLEQWLVAGAARALLERCLARYELDRQPEVIAHASELFREVTDGRYGHVVVEEDDDADRRNVIAIRDSGERVDAADLSRGTAEQLYLCLRLGFAQSFAEQSVELPFVIDDILVNFDPRRASAVAGILARVARSHQVIAFTCHPHVRELFEAASPGLQVVQLA